MTEGHTAKEKKNHGRDQQSIDGEPLTRATKLMMLMLKLTFCRADTKGFGSIHGIVSNQAETYIIGAERKVLITIPEVTYKGEGRTKYHHHHHRGKRKSESPEPLAFAHFA